MKAKTKNNHDVFTKATDFLGAVSSGVDSRTGIYSVNLNLATLTSHKGLGPDFDLNLRYSPLSYDNYGFGKGFSIGVTIYDRSMKILKLYTGEQYKIEDSKKSNDDVRVLGLKICHFKFKKINNNEYVVSYKNGRKEYLKGAGDAAEIKTVYKIISLTQQTLCLEWDYSWERGVRLISVHNEGEISGSLINIEYTEESKSTVQVYKNTKEAYGVELIFFNNYLTKMKSFGINNTVRGSNVHEWTFAYTDSSDGPLFQSWGRWLNKVSYPGGMTEKAKYNYESGHAFPSTSNLPDLPYVKTFERFLDETMHSLVAKSDYKFSKENFLGGNTSYRWGSQGVDENGLEYIFTLWKLNPEYTYSCTETRVIDSKDNKQKEIITSTYNIFHLMVLQRNTDGIDTITNSVEYYASTYSSPVSQPANLTMPKKSIQTIKNRRGEQTILCTDTQYDEYANMTAKTVKRQLDGTLVEPSVKIEYYYGAEEKKENDIELCCPSDPDGFVKYIKSITVSPLTKKNNEEIKTQYFSYKDIGSGVIQKIRESQINSLNTVTTTFFYDTTEGNFGRVTGKEHVLTRGKKTHKSLTTYNYTDEENSYAQHITYVAFDSKKASDDKKQSSAIFISKYTGRILKEIEPTGLVTEYEYDYIGRVINKRTKTNDSEEMVERYIYFLNLKGTYPIKTLHIHSDGVQTLHELDSLGRIAQTRINTEGDDGELFTSWPVIEKYEYDLKGRKIKETRFDYLRNETVFKNIMDKSVAYKYDIWGNECQRITSSGLTEIIEFDPVAMTNTFNFNDNKGKPLLGEIIEKINHLGSKLEVTQYSLDKKEAITSSMSRDGWNRVVNKINAYGKKLLQEFDCYDRVIKETRYDGNQFIYEYASFSTESYLESIEIEMRSDHTENDKNAMQAPAVRSLIGKKQYDGLGRLTENKAFSRRWSYEYDTDTSPSPSKIIDPSGIVKIVKYENILGQKVKEADISPSDSKLCNEKFKYNKITGSLLEGIGNNCIVKRDYNKSGFLQSESLSFDAGMAKGIQYKWSLGGLLFLMTDSYGFSQENLFDEFGRVVQVKGDKVDITYKYDELSRITSKIALKKDKTHQIETTISYDEFGRESYRKLHDTLHTANTRIIRQSWDKLNRLILKDIFSLNNGEENKILTEKYEYNSNGFIVAYNCIKFNDEGLPHIPTDKYGNIIVHESYEYDSFGSVIKNTKNFLPSKGDSNSIENSNNAVFVYDSTERTRLVELTNTHKSYPSRLKFEYDLNGNMIAFGKNTLAYDAMGRVNKINDQPYIYDALDRMVKAGEKERLYSFRQLRSENGDRVSRTSLFVGHYGAESHQGDIVLTACDGKESCIYAANSDRGEWQAYSVYGESNATRTSLSFTGFNGDHHEDTLNAYVPGSGYRLYSPDLMRFITPDSPFNSPFGSAGINPYTYCLGDPVNNADPTGQISWQGWVSMMAGGIGLMMTVLTGGLSIVAAGGIMATSLAIGATAASLISGVTAIVGTAISGVSPEATRILRWVSLGTGLLSFSSGVAGMAQGIYKAMGELGLKTTLATMGFTSRVGLTLNTISYAAATASYSISLTKRILDQTALAKSRLNTILGHIGFGVGIISDAASISHFTLSKAMPRSYSWDVPRSTTMDEISLRSLTPGGNSLEANIPGSYAHYSEVFIPQINNFFLHIPLQARS